MQITNKQYWAEVNNLAASIVLEAANYTDCNAADTFNRDTVLEKIHDTILHETIDDHQWVIYYAYNLDVLQYSDNAEYMIDNLGVESAGEILKESGLSGLHNALASWAFYADVADHLDSALDDYESNLEPTDQE